VYRAYLTKATTLMKKYAPFLMTGTYCDIDHFTITNPDIEARSFRTANRLAVVLTQSHLVKASTDLTVPGYAVIEHGGIGEYTAQPATGAVHVTLARDALALVVFEKK
jgi:hypothetical protein